MVNWVEIQGPDMERSMDPSDTIKEIKLEEGSSSITLGISVNGG
jgi:hypothetical protein